MKKFSLVFVAGILFLGSCKQVDKKKGSEGDKEETPESNTTLESTQKTVAGKGEVMLGGKFTFAIEEEVTELNPLQTEDIYSYEVVSQIFEGLVRYNPKTLSIQPAIAESWDLSDDQKEFTFHLRKDAKFHSDTIFEGGIKVITAADVKYSYELLCTKTENEGITSNYENIFEDALFGAEDFHKGKSNTIKGIEIVDDYTLKLTLTKPFINFINKLALPAAAIVSKEAIEAYGDSSKVGSGPFKYHHSDESSLWLTKNENYYGVDEQGNKLPYIDTVHIRFIKDRNEQLEEFNAGNLSMIAGLPASRVNEVVIDNIDQYKGNPPSKILKNEPEMSTHYYEFNMTREHFKDVRVRKAFNYAIDRKKIIEKALSNQANQFGEYGITPPVSSMKGYDFEGIAKFGYKQDKAKARQLLAEAGYPNGEGFPEIVLYTSRSTVYNKAAKEIAHQLQMVLGINVIFNAGSFVEKMNVAKHGKADLTRSAWIGDYPSPETFLLNCYGKHVPASLSQPSHPNTSRYKNAEYDAILETAMITNDKTERYKLFSNAEKMLMQDPPFIILWYAEDPKLFHAKEIRNFETNALSILDLTKVYFKPWSESEWKEKHH